MMRFRLSGAMNANGGEQKDFAKTQIVHVFRIVVHMVIGSVLMGKEGAMMDKKKNKINLWDILIEKAYPILTTIILILMIVMLLK